MAKRALTVTLQVGGIREVLRAFNRLPKDANARLREGSLALSQSLARSAQNAARSDSAQSALMAGTVKANRDRVPNVSAGGAKRVGSGRAPAYAILFGSEFGMNQRSGWYAAAKYAGSGGEQYRPHRGRMGYWFFPTVEREQNDIIRAWAKVADDIIRDFQTDGA